MWTGAGPASHRPGPHRSSPPSARAPTNSAARKLPLAAQIALGQAGLRPCRIRARLDGRRRNEVLASRIRVNLAHGWHFPVPAGASPGESPISARLLTTKGAGYPGRARPQLFGSSPRRALATPVAHDHNYVAHNEFASSLLFALCPRDRQARWPPPCYPEARWLPRPATARRAGWPSPRPPGALAPGLLTATRWPRLAWRKARRLPRPATPGRTAARPACRKALPAPLARGNHMCRMLRIRPCLGSTGSVYRPPGTSPADPGHR
jgi:hypothetical protein